MYCQAYFEYDTKKSFGITKSHLRFGKHPISSTYYVEQRGLRGLPQPDVPDQVRHYPRAEAPRQLPAELRVDGGRAGAACSRRDPQATSPTTTSTFYIIDANKESQALGLGNRSNMVLQAAFFKLANVIPVEDAVAHMKDAVKKTYGLKGEKVVNMNIAAVDAGINALVEVKVKPEWTNLTGKALKPADDEPALRHQEHSGAHQRPEGR